ncbi:MAG TPA: [FeFe] hydrogenase H-cluster maturation GTPase HydF [Planctomycetaceae bacterium]|nr:[FeFe] hydrogenase H-cluster maturation GTPase HydF [Planctomycetaceae bacterium]
MESTDGTPKGFRLHLALFGRRNAGKSSLLNMMSRQQSSLVSEIAGTTTDPVEKPMELLPIGPVLFIDTAGIDDVGTLGRLRIEKTRQVFERTDIGLLVVGDGVWGDFERSIGFELARRKIPFLVVFSKSDIVRPSEDTSGRLESAKIPLVVLSAFDPNGRNALLEGLLELVPETFLSPPPILADLLPAGELAVFVVPIDKEAPKGRLILPQVQTIRDVLDGDQGCLVVKTGQLKDALDRLNRPPAIVVTDSQVLDEVGALVPRDIPLTTFSILFARQKGDLATMVDGARAIGKLPPQSRVLIAESCGHHPIAEDIGTAKIPNRLRQTVGPDLTIEHVHGHDFPASHVADWDLVIHCGACMWNRREMLSRMMHCRASGVPITNYGLAIAAMSGILERAIEPFGIE